MHGTKFIVNTPSMVNLSKYLIQNTTCTSDVLNITRNAVSEVIMKIMSILANIKVNNFV